MIGIPITKHDLKLAESISEPLIQLKHNIKNVTASEKDMVLAGILGQMFVTKYLGVTTSDTYDYDIIFNKNKIEVKSALCSNEPTPYYDCKVNGYIKQSCDYYVFVHILRDFSKLWIAGIYPQKEFYQKARYAPKGEKQPNGLIFRADAYILKIKDLYPFRTLHSQAL